MNFFGTISKKPVQETLHSAIIKGLPCEEIKPLIQPHTVNKIVDGKSALYLAVESQDVNIVRLFREHKPNVVIGESATKNSCLHLAVSQDSATMFMSSVISVQQTI